MIIGLFPLFPIFLHARARARSACVKSACRSRKQQARSKSACARIFIYFVFIDNRFVMLSPFVIFNDIDQVVRHTFSGTASAIDA